MKYIVGFIALLTLLVASCASQQQEITSFEDCAAAGYPIMESYPRQCRTPNGDLFVEDVDLSTEINNNGEGQFCGQSTHGACTTDDDCVQSGCSGQICQGASEEPAFSTCEYKACYNNENYGVGCGCVQGQCQWS